MNSRIQAEMLYQSRKKSMLIAYIIGGIGGSLGLNYFYAGRYDLGCAMILLLLATLANIPLVGITFFICVVGSLFYTKVVIDEVNRDIKAECFAMIDDQLKGE